MVVVSELVTFGEATARLAPRDGERLETVDELTFRAGGPAANVAVAAERLGTDAALITKLPDSPLGRKVAGDLRRHGLEVDVVWADADARQGLTFVEHGGRPRGSAVHYDRAGSAFGTVTPEELPRGRIGNAGTFFVTGVTPSLSGEMAELTAKLLAAASDAGVRTAFDVNYRSGLWDAETAEGTLTQLFPAVDVLFVSLREARNVLGIERNPREMANHLAAEWDFETVVVTRGENGSLALHDSTIHEQGIHETDTVAPIAGGDAFAGAFLARRLAGDDVRTAQEYAAATAALKRTIRGDQATVTQQEVERVMAGDDEAVLR